MLLIYFVLLILSTATRAQQPLQIDHAPDVQTCGNTIVKYTWSGGTPPYWLTFWGYYDGVWQEFSDGLLLSDSDDTAYVYTYIPDNKTFLCRMELQDWQLYGSSTYLHSNNFTVTPCPTDTSSGLSSTATATPTSSSTSMGISSMSMDTSSADLPMSTTSSGLVIGALTNVYTCSNVTSITYLWAGGSPPYDVSLVLSGNMNDVVLKLASRITSTSITQWVTPSNISSKWTDISLEVVDKDGQMAGSQTFSILPCSAGRSSSKVGAIVGGTVGGICAIVIVAGGTWYLLHRKRKQNAIQEDGFVVDNNDYEPRPFRQVTSAIPTTTTATASLGWSSSGAGVTAAPTQTSANRHSIATVDHDDAPSTNMHTVHSASPRSAGTPSLPVDDASITNRTSTHTSLSNTEPGSTHARDSGMGFSLVDGLLPPIYEPGWQQRQAATGGAGAGGETGRETDWETGGGIGGGAHKKWEGYTSSQLNG